MTTAEHRPREGTGAQGTTARKSTSESNRTVGRTAAGAPNLVTMRPDYARAFIAGYREGYQHGVVRALDDVEAADDRAWAQLSKRVRRQSMSPRFSQLATRRGDLERADRARQWERSNGLGTVA